MPEENYTSNQTPTQDFDSQQPVVPVPTNAEPEKKTKPRTKKPTLSDAIKSNRELWRKVKTAYTKRIVADIESGGDGGIGMEKFVRELIDEGLNKWK